MDPTQVQLIRDYEPALFFFGYPGEAGAERFFPSDAKRYIEHAALYLAKKPFATRPDWGAPIVEADQLRANEQEGGVFLGKRDGSGHPLYLETPPDQECFLEVSGWKSDDQRADLDRLAARYAEANPSGPGPNLKKSQFWYHAEFFDAGRLHSLFDHVDPGGSATHFSELFGSVLTDPALICYYLFYPGHEESLPGCAGFETASDYGSFAGEWSCIALLLDRANTVGAAYVPKWVGLTNRNIGVIRMDSESPEVRTGMRILPWSAMQTFGGNHPRFQVAKGSHGLYLPGEAIPPVQPLTSDDLAAGHCGGAAPIVNSIDEIPITFPYIPAAKIVAGANTGGIFGPVGAALGAAAGVLWSIAELSPVTVNDSYLPTTAPTVDAVSPSGLVIHPVGVRPAEVDPSRAMEWRSADNVQIDGRHYDFTVDRATQVLWGTDPAGPGYTGRWGPDVAGDAQGRRAGMKFPKFWQLFFDALVRNEPPARVIVLKSDAGATWTVPADWNNANNTIELIGGGGGGSAGNEDGNSGAGGGGGAYVKDTNVALTPSTVLSIAVGAAGAGGKTPGASGAAGGDTTLNFNSGVMIAKGGAGGITGATPKGGAGGSEADSAGTTTFAGGTGGAADATGAGGAGGGGGGGGPNGKGGAGGASIYDAVTVGGGGGGGGNGGGKAGAGTAGTNSGGGGGNNFASDGAGAGSSGPAGPGADGRAGGGGGGGFTSPTNGIAATAGGAGGAGFDLGNVGGGGGGGGAGSGAGSGDGMAGGSAGNYGGGGGGGGRRGHDGVNPGLGGDGAPGVIKITYTPP